jgi:hypothetical protein
MSNFTTGLMPNWVLIGMVLLTLLFVLALLKDFIFWFIKRRK